MKIIPRNFINLKLDLHLLKEKKIEDLVFTEIFFHQENQGMNNFHNNDNLFIYKKNFNNFDKIFQNDKIESKIKIKKRNNFQIKNDFSFLELEKLLNKLFFNDMDYENFLKINSNQMTILKTIIFVKLKKKKIKKKNFKKYFENFNIIDNTQSLNPELIKFSMKSFKNYLKNKFFKFKKINFFEKYYLGEKQINKCCNLELFKILKKKDKFCIDFKKFIKDHLEFYFKRKIKKNLQKFLLKLKTFKGKSINNKILFKFTKKNFKLISFTFNELNYQTKNFNQ